jgi:hypothetical protein
MPGARGQASFAIPHRPGPAVVGAFSGPHVLQITGVTVDVTGVRTTALLGAVAVNAGAKADETGVRTTTTLGTVTVNAGAAPAVTGRRTTATLGTTTANAGATPAVTGRRTTAALGTTTPNAGARADESGLRTAAVLGLVIVQAGAVANVAGLRTVATLGTVTVDAGTPVVTPPVGVGGGSSFFGGMDRARRSRLDRELQAALDAPDETYPAKKQTAATRAATPVVPLPSVALPVRRLAVGAVAPVRRRVVVARRPLPTVRVVAGSVAPVESVRTVARIGVVAVTSGATARAAGRLTAYGMGRVHVFAIRNPSDDELVQQHFTYLQAA